jgi:hypothetical protein
MRVYDVGLERDLCEAFYDCVPAGSHGVALSADLRRPDHRIVPRTTKAIGKLLSDDLSS